MPIRRSEHPDDRERILSELRTIAPISLTKFDLTKHLRLSYSYAVRILRELEVNRGEPCHVVSC